MTFHIYIGAMQHPWRYTVAHLMFLGQNDAPAKPYSLPAIPLPPHRGKTPVYPTKAAPQETVESVGIPDTVKVG